MIIAFVLLILLIVCLAIDLVDKQTAHSDGARDD